jgi:suppressor of G2 allele of SKP1
MCIHTGLLTIQASLTISIPDKPEGVYDLDPLARSIDAEKSIFKIGKLKVELILAKAQPGLKWKELDGIDEEGTNTGTISGGSGLDAPSCTWSFRRQC